MIKAYGEHILIKRDPAPAHAAGGIQLLDNSSRHSGTGEVLSVGCHVDNPAIKPGARLLFSEFAGDEITWGSETFLLIHSGDALATIDL